MNFGGEMIAFFLLAAGAIIGAILFVTFKNIVHALLSIVLTFISIAGLYVLLSAEFIAGAQILIYSGAITIILLFAIMLTKNTDEQKITRRKDNWLIIIAIIVLAKIIYRGIMNIFGTNTATMLHENNTEQIGMLLYSKYIIPFELISVLLLAALIGAIVLARKEEEGQ